MIKKPLNLSLVAALDWRYLLASLMLFVGQLSMSAQTTLNVTDYGAKGDAVQFYANTVSNSAVITTETQFSTADIGKAIEVFGCGTNTVGTNCQDMVTTIANVVSGTNIYLNQTCQNTLNGTFATVGTDNTSNFQACIDAASGTNTIINVPAGKYLLLPRSQAGLYGYFSLLFSRGGVHLIGAGMTNTVLLGQGAWVMHGADAWRGFLFEIHPPVINDYPFSVENLTLDGGVEQGNTSNHGFQNHNDTVAGLGWDMSHDAILVWTSISTANTFTHQTWANVMFTHWRGEMVKSLDQSTNGNIAMTNCVFADGNATAINIYAALDINGCTFSNLFQIGEYYQQYSTNTSYFRNSYVTNITGNAWAWNGATGKNPPFIMQSNVFYFNGYGRNGLQTTPGDNIQILDNQFIVEQYMNVIVLGVPGYQGTFCNSNILIAGNSVQCLVPGGTISSFIEYGAAPPNNVVNVTIVSNSITGGTVQHALLSYSTASNNYSGVVIAFNNFGTSCGFQLSGGVAAPYPLIQTNNLIPPITISSSGGTTNLLAFNHGTKYVAVYVRPPSTFILSDSDSNLIPAGAWMQFDNSLTNQFGGSFTYYLSQRPGSPPATLAAGQVQNFYWNKIKGGYAWMTYPIIPPLNLRTNL